jgi:hypothetical protein
VLSRVVAVGAMSLHVLQMLTKWLYPTRLLKFQDSSSISFATASCSCRIADSLERERESERESEREAEF